MRPRDIGTRAETAVVRYLAANGFPYAERRSLKGALDQGDVTGIPGVCIEIKGGEAARAASDGQVERWMHETAVEKDNAGAWYGVLVVQRLRQPVNRWWAIVPGGTLAALVATHSDDWCVSTDGGPTVRLHLSAVASLLVEAGYGVIHMTALDQDAP